MATPSRTVKLFNERVQNFYEYGGVEMDVMELSKLAKVSYPSLLLRLKNPNTTVEQALSAPASRGTLGTGRKYLVRGEFMTATQIHREFKIRVTLAYLVSQLKAGRGPELMIHKYGED